MHDINEARAEFEREFQKITGCNAVQSSQLTERLIDLFSILRTEIRKVDSARINTPKHNS